MCRSVDLTNICHASSSKIAGQHYSMAIFERLSVDEAYMTIFVT